MTCNFVAGKNSFTGQLPTELGLLSELREIRIGKDLYSRGISVSFCTDGYLIETIFTSIIYNLTEDNGFTGSIPIEVALMERLRAFTAGEFRACLMFLIALSNKLIIQNLTFMSCVSLSR